MVLTTDQLQAIDRHLRKDNWLLNESLITELTDHYVAGIEDRMGTGVAFDMALKMVHTGFGGRKGLLKMEEDYQIQKQRAVGRLEWQTVRSFMGGPRWPVTLGIFGLFYVLNAHLDYTDMVNSGLLIATFYMTISVLTTICLSLWFFYSNRKEINAAVTHPTSAVYLTLYCFTLVLMGLNKYGLTRYGVSLSPWLLTVVETLLETLCVVYYIAIGLSVRNLFKSNRLKKA